MLDGVTYAAGFWLERQLSNHPSTSDRCRDIIYLFIYTFCMVAEQGLILRNYCGEEYKWRVLIDSRDGIGGENTCSCRHTRNKARMGRHGHGDEKATIGKHGNH